MPDPSPTPIQTPPKRKKRLRIVLWLLSIPLILVIAGAVLVGTGSLSGFVIPIIERETGLSVTQGSIVLSPTGEIEFRDAVLRAPDIGGPGGEVIRMDRATISLRWTSILAGADAIRSVKIDRPRLRVSQDTETGIVNLQSLKLQQSDGGGAVTPAITINQGIIEVGEHTGSNYTRLKDLSVVGGLAKPNANGVAKFDFFATSTESSVSDGVQSVQDDFTISGTLSGKGVQGVMTGLTLEDWPADIVPTRVRDFYDSLALSGQLAPTRFSVGLDGRPQVVLTLDGVDVSLPFIPPAEFSGPEKFLRMRSTKGTIAFGFRGMRANLEGDIDDLLYDVSLDYKGYSQSSPFLCDLQTRFRIEPGFRPLRFLPERVTEKLDRFVDLVADIDATVSLVRETDSDPNDDITPPILVSGTAEVSNGSAKYNEFMYPFENIEGTVSFHPDGVTIDGITGTGSSGAKLHANGEFVGMGEDSVVEIIINVDELPIDHLLLGAMDEDQRELVDTLFSRSQYDNLLDSGYLLEPNERTKLTRQRDELSRRIASLDRDTPESDRAALSSDLARMNTLLRVPEFDFGGLIGVEVTLKRHPERPEDDRWTTDIDAVIPSAGIVPKQFPLPIVARNVQISIVNNSVYLSGGVYQGLSGGTAEVDARFEPREGFDDPQPYVEIKARGIPIDDRLIAAIPGYYDAQPIDPSEITLRRILDRLRMQGFVGADAKIGPGDDGSINYYVEADVLSGSAHPLSMGLQLLDESTIPIENELGLDSVQLADMTGTIVVNKELIVVDIKGTMESPSQPIPPTPIEMLTQLTLSPQPKFGNIKRNNGLLPFEAGPPVSGPLIYTRVKANGLDLGMPLEHAIAVLSPSFANRVASWRKEFDPDGVLDLRALLEGRVGSTMDTTLSINQINSTGFTFEDHRYEFGSSIGSVGLRLGSKPKVESRGFSIPFSIDHEPMGEIGLAGSLRLAQGAQLLELKDEPSMRLSMSKGRLGSPGVRAIVDRMGSGNQSGGAKDFFDYYGLDGEFNLLIDITPIDGARISNAPPGVIGFPAIEVDGSMIPRSLTLQRDGNILDFKKGEIEGAIRFDGLDGYFDNIRANNSDYTLALDGKWAVTPGQGAWVDLVMAAHGDIINGPVRAILPDTLSSVIDQLEVKSGREIDLEHLHIIADRLGTDSTAFAIDGSATVLDVSALVGVPITELDGRVDFNVQSGIIGDSKDSIPDQSSGLRYQLDLEASRLRAGLLRVHNAQTRIFNDPDSPSVVLVPEFRAGMHGGMVSGNAQVRPLEDGTLWYASELRCSGVRAAPIFDDLFLPIAGLEGPPAPGSSTVRSAWNVDSDVSKGVMNADLAISGPIGLPDERYGRGFVRVSGGSIVALPGLINLIEASNLKLPIGSRLNLAEAEIYIDGPTMSFERLSASSDAIEILGYGTMDWTSRDIDLRFRSRSIKPIPVLSTLLEGIRDELITIRVEGAPGSITYSPEQFGTTKRLLDSMFGSRETEQQRRLREVEGRTRVGSGRLRRKQGDQVIEPTPQNQTESTSATAETTDE
jgi:hypothetical protein